MRCSAVRDVDMYEMVTYKYFTIRNMVRYEIWCGVGYCNVYADRRHVLTYENGLIRDVVRYETWGKWKRGEIRCMVHVML